MVFHVRWRGCMSLHGLYYFEKCNARSSSAVAGMALIHVFGYSDIKYGLQLVRPFPVAVLVKGIKGGLTWLG